MKCNEIRSNSKKKKNKTRKGRYDILLLGCPKNNTMKENKYL